MTKRILLLILLLLSSPAYAENFCDRDTAQACYTFDWIGDTTVRDESQNSNTGTFNGTAAFTTTNCFQGSCLFVDGNSDWVSVTDHSSLYFGDELSIVAWTYPDGFGVSEAQVVAKDKNGTGTREFNLRFVNSGRPYFHFFKATDSETTVSSIGTACTTGAACHIAATYDYVTDGTSKVRIYSQGVRVDTSSDNMAGPIQNTTSPLTIGRRDYSGFESYFDGNIDDVGLFSEVLTATEINQVYEQGLGFESGRLWSSGFELQSVTSGIEWDSITAVDVSIDTTIKRSGAASIKTAPTGFPSFIKHAFRSANKAGVYGRAYFRFDGLPATAETSLFSFLESSTERIGVDLQTDGTLDVDVPGESTVTGTTVLSAGTWYHLELKADPANTSWELRIAEDGSALATESSGTLGSGTIDSVQLSNDNVTDDIDIWFDDVAVNDSRGTYQNSWPGNGRIVHLHPNANGDNDSGFESPTSSSWEVMDEITPDDASTAYELRSNDDIVDVNIEAGSAIGMDEGAGDTITLVSVGTRVVGDNSTPATYYTRLKSQSSGTVAQSVLIELTSASYVTHSDDTPNIYTLTSYVDPQAGGAWTTSLIDSTQIGMQVKDAIPDVWTTAMWLLVEYAEPEAAATSTFKPIMFMY